MNAAEQGRARLEEMYANEALAVEAGERAWRTLQVLGGVELSDDDKARYMIGFRDGFRHGRAHEREA